MILTAENYFSKEASMKYMGVSQFKAFEECEAGGLAKAKCEFDEEKTVALLVGSYVDAHFEGTLDVFKAQNPAIFTLKGDLRAEYKKANEIINRIESDSEFMKFLSGEKQVIMKGEIEGVPVKIKIDSYFPDEKIVDLKVMKDFAPIWKDGQKMPYFEAWGYDLQAAVYQEIVRQFTGELLPFYIAAATKEKTTDIQGLIMPQEFLDERLSYFRGLVRHYDNIKKGIEKPIRCGKCDFCKATKHFEVINAADLYMEV
ncbi:PD-(D/E)XK nuclease-like domain-containing protein [Anaerotignum sp. MB30-C6]|uniref:PD-(D/E)XK nuclease-like domain-containing protein n=1 Tax=Anaerotignum sp. MB30-C6 TaxID=3070814 RepID=UPI0027DD936C|nr:PD-(D/E)XK nuclease-like domain-containing protein [Anaerotignum sp. MB30-C6]WMI80937.1 PD-(D/E)XK nuclease-like domain-containing protein [Anaerotignum sp. MB30-C6]